MENITFKMKIQDSFEIEEIGVGVTGIIDEGCVRIGDLVSIGNKGQFIVKGIEHYRQLYEKAERGMGVGLLIPGLDIRDAVAGEYVIM